MGHYHSLLFLRGGDILWSNVTFTVCPGVFPMACKVSDFTGSL